MPSRPTSSDRGAMPAGAIIAVSLAVAAVLGLIAGAVWGQIGGSRPVAVPSGSTSAPASPSTPAPSASDTGSSPAPTADSSTPTPTAASPTGAAPPAPATTSTSADGWRLGSWRITNTGTLGVDTTARNTATGTRSATLVLYVYIGGQLVATTTTVVTDVPAGATVPVHFSGSDPWKPGDKVLLLQTA